MSITKRQTSRRPGTLFPLILAMVIAGFGAGAATADDAGTISTDEDELFGSPLSTTDDSAIDTDEDSLFGSSDEDSLFGGDPLIVESEDSNVDLSSVLLVSDAVDIGGRYSFSVRGRWGWNDPGTFFENLIQPDSMSMSTTLSSQVYLDARPDSNFRVFAKASLRFPFETVDANVSDTPPERTFQDVLHVEEMFSDFNWKERIFFRVGKQNMNWGVGYFYSPADLLSIAEVDPEDPEAEREGPVAIKANIPIGINNIYLYALPAGVTDPEPLDMGLAVKGEVVVGPGEIGAGLIYQRDIAPAAMATASFSVGDVDVFGEATLSYGSNRTYVVETGTPPFVAAQTRSDEFFASATAGFSYQYSPDEADDSLMIIGQYLYNGEGYSDPSIIQDNPFFVGSWLLDGTLKTTDLVNIGVHYTAINASWSSVFGSDINANVFWMQNYTDMSAMVTPSISTTVLDSVNLSLQVPLMIGDEGAELSPFGNNMAISLSVSMGGGRF